MGHRLLYMKPTTKAMNWKLRRAFIEAHQTNSPKMIWCVWHKCSQTSNSWAADIQPKRWSESPRYPKMWRKNSVNRVQIKSNERLWVAPKPKVERKSISTIASMQQPAFYSSPLFTIVRRLTNSLIFTLFF